jgi:heme-degrading monooxygenase HmoA
MSVLMTLRATADGRKLEEYAGANPDTMQEIVEHAKEHGLIAHRFYATDDGKVMVVDEWPDAESFQTFFDHERERIGPMMEAAGMTGDPEVQIWRKLDTGDEVGWQ